MALTQNPCLSLSGVSLSLGDAPVVEDIHLTLGNGEILVLLGPSGCGKTSLLRLMAGLLQPDAGTILLNDQPPLPGHGSAVVFQSYRLLPWKTVRGNIAFALPGLAAPKRIVRVEDALRRVGLSRFADAYPGTLSGGMKQRAALARALVTQPDFLLMDEPFAALDAQARELMQAELLQLVGGDDGPGVVFVTHSVDEALMLGDRIAILSPRPGRVMTMVDVPFPRPRWQKDPRDDAAWAGLRRMIWQQMRNSILTHPTSDFRDAQVFWGDKYAE